MNSRVNTIFPKYYCVPCVRISFLVFYRIYKFKDTISFWTLLDDNARNKSIKLPESSAVLQIVNTWMRNKNYPLVRIQIDGDDLVLKQVNIVIFTSSDNRYESHFI